MSLTAKCRRCSRVFQAGGLIGGTGNSITFVDCVLTCPLLDCGGQADIQSGTYDFVDGMITAFKAPGITRKKVEAFREIAELAAKDKITADQAAAKAAEFNCGLG